VCLALVASACSGSGGDTTTTTGADTTTTTAGAPITAPPGFDAACTVEVTGDEPRAWVGPDDDAFASDHWQSEEELRVQYEFLAIQDDPPFEELLESGLPVFTYFLMSCVGVEGDTVAIFVSDETRRDDLPMTPGSYPISGGLFTAGDLPAGVFSASYLPATGTVWGEEGSGTITITRWDLSRVQGSFAFVAEERFVDPSRVVEVTGTFDFACTRSEVCR
jgi:hypothetical protein